MLTAARTALAELLGGIRTPRKPAVRRAADSAWMLATDLPLLVSEEETARFLTLARDAGWRTGRAANGWLLLDCPALLPTAPVPEPLPDGETGALISLLLRHPSKETDLPALRAVAGSSEQGRIQLERVCAGLHAAWAEALRKHEKIPGALLPYLCAAVRETEV